jgi:two-component system sensor histidine kinase KdpD
MHMMPVRRCVLGIIAALATAGVLIGIMLPLRSHLDSAVVALVLVVPVVVAVVVGGFASGIVAVGVGFVGYDMLFIKPYGTLAVGRAENWAALGVYVVVMLLVSGVVDRLAHAQAQRREQQADTEQLFALSEYLVADRPGGELADLIVKSVRATFGLRSAVLLLPVPGAGAEASSAPGGTGALLEVAAADGDPLDEATLTALRPVGGTATRLRPVASPRPEAAGEAPEVIQTVVLSVGDRTVGFLGVVGAPLPRHRDELLRAFANHMAAAIDRLQLHEQAVRVGILEEVDRQRRTLLGAVSHDVRTPLSTIKTSASALLDGRLTLAPEDREALLELIEDRADRLERVVANLLDLGRIQAGALALDREKLTVPELFEEVLVAVGPVAEQVEIQIETGLPPLEADRTLMVEALVNLVENAVRYAPAGTKVGLRAARCSETAIAPAAVRLSVSDEGPGIEPGDRERVFHMFEQGSVSAGEPGRGGTGLGLAIARAFVEANGGSIALLPSTRPGTTIALELPLSSPETGVDAVRSTPQ